jgi:amino acid adenylation domain-containing protein
VGIEEVPSQLWARIGAAITAHSDQLSISYATGKALTYSQLGERIVHFSSHLTTLGCSEGTRVGLYMDKSVDMVVMMLALLRIGAAYVPVDPDSPVARNIRILRASRANMIAATQAQVAVLSQELSSDAMGGFEGMTVFKLSDPDDVQLDEAVAYILHTSGSTGEPKGVVTTHSAVLSFIDYCTEIFQPTPNDVVCAFAPFHFAMSVFDIYLALLNGSHLVLVDTKLIRHPPSLVELVSQTHISIWYSTPSALRLLMNNDFTSRKLHALRLVLFAGETFPQGDLQRLYDGLDQVKLYNLYGSTETNVMALHHIEPKLGKVVIDNTLLGKPCRHFLIRVANAEGKPLPAGEEGEIQVSSPALFSRYSTQDGYGMDSFLYDADGQRWHRTGDFARINEDGDLAFVGRRNRIVKVKGYRVALGEVEAALYRHPKIADVAVTVKPDGSGALDIEAYYTTPDSKKVSLIELKRFCSGQIPLNHIPSRFIFCEQMPRTPSGKINYKRLT